MHFIGQVRVIPHLPQAIQRLQDLAYNFYFTWHPEVRDLFIAIDRQLWKQVNHNPVRFLQVVQQNKLEEKANDREFLSRFNQVLKQFDAYINEKNTWFVQHFPEYKNHTIAYFTAEFGFHESLPIYAGGLGVLAGDHMKSASDLGIPLVGISLFYNQTYFTQEIDSAGNQIALYQEINPLELPLRPVLNAEGTPLLVSVPLAHREVKVRVWEARVGRISAYLLDSNVPENSPQDRQITSRLYGGDQETRISQEILLGMGGARVLKAMGIEPQAWHMNEGHSVFMALQRIENLVKERGLSFPEALEAVSINTIFTTHTPVPAGNDAFPLDIKDKYFHKYWESVGIKRHEFMELGSQVQPEGYEIFNLTILALNLSRYRNVVSQLHAEVSRRLWKTVWPDVPSSEVPISYITNGVHALTWISRKMRDTFTRHLSPRWMESIDATDFWNKVDEIPDEVLWKTKLALKEKMINHVRERLEKQFKRNKIGSHRGLRIRNAIRTETLTIGFARRFATYKRGTLIFRDIERLKRLINHPERPVQIIFAGKAHPKDTGGQELIRQIYQISMQPEFRGKVIFVENYDVGLARDLISGVDVWLNNPLRTQEASGTSGQKAGMNGGLNFSVLDGWWCEGYRGDNGWAFGDQDDFPSQEEWNAWDSEELYDILENEIIPLYYQRDENDIPHQWIQFMKNSIKTILPVFNTHRMVKEYLQTMYLPAFKMAELYSRENFRIAREISQWKERIQRFWSDVRIVPNHNHTLQQTMEVNFGEELPIETVVELGRLTPEDVRVQMYMVRLELDGSLSDDFEVFDLSLTKKLEPGKFLYSGKIKPSDSGNYRYTFRVLPYHPHQVNPVEVGLIHWLNGEAF